MHKVKIYTVYERKSGQPVAYSLPAAECAKLMGIEIQSFYRFVMEQKQGKRLMKWEITDEGYLDKSNGVGHWPCEKCAKKDTCTNNKCQFWVEWFLKSWKKFNAYYEKYGRKRC